MVVAHFLQDQKRVSYFDLLSNFNVGLALLLTYLASFLAILNLFFLINELTNRIRFEGKGRVRFFKRALLFLNGLRNKRVSAIAVFFLSVRLFLWLTQLFLTNNIKTNKVVSGCFCLRLSARDRSKLTEEFSFIQVVDTSQLIKDEQDIFATRKVACMLAEVRKSKKRTPFWVVLFNTVYSV